MRDTYCSVVEIAARLLQPSEREAVLGDLSEAGEGVWHGLLDVGGLVIRRQLLPWRSWRPWLAAFGLALPCSLVLMGLSVAVSLRYEHLGGRGLSGSLQDSFLHLLCGGLLPVACSWVSGFVMGTISRQTLWASITSSCIPCLYCLTRFRESSLSPLCLFLFLLPAIWGVRYALRPIRISLALAISLAITITALTILPPNSRSLWPLNWALVWPAWYTVATAAFQWTERQAR